MSKEIQTGLDSIKKLVEGVNDVAKAVKVTMGPKGSNVIIDQGGGNPNITKDGVTVARSIYFSDTIKNMGATMIKNAAEQTNLLAGDGTTTTTVLTQSIVENGLKHLESGTSGIAIKKMLDASAEKVIDLINSWATPINGRIKEVAMISSNGDEVISSIIEEAISQTGGSGLVNIVPTTKDKDKVEVVSGLKINRGYFTSALINMEKKKCIEYQNCVLLLFKGKLKDVSALVNIMNGAAQTFGDIGFAIVARDIDEGVIGTMVRNKHENGAKFILIKSPGIGEEQEEYYKDISALSGANVVSDLGTLQVEDLGYFGRISCSKDQTVFSDPGQFDGTFRIFGENGEIISQEPVNIGGYKSKVNTRIEQLKSQLEKLDTHEATYKNVEERLAMMKGGISTIYVGGESETEMLERRDRIEDAVNAVQSAIKSGVVSGAGISMLDAAKSLKENKQMTIGDKILVEALVSPSKTILENAEVDIKMPSGIGFNLNDMTPDEDIIDPALVITTSIRKAVSAASMILTTKCVISETSTNNGLVNMIN